MDDDKIEISGHEEGTRLRRSSRFVIGTLKIQIHLNLPIFLPNIYQLLAKAKCLIFNLGQKLVKMPIHQHRKKQKMQLLPNPLLCLQKNRKIDMRESHYMSTAIHQIQQNQKR